MGGCMACGMVGGMGGGMVGGVGGGGMGGGGMFSVPAEVFPAQSSAEEKPSSSFTNDSVQSSKKKLSGAR